MSLSLIGVLILAGTTSLDGIVNAQARWWFVLPQFVGCIIYIITAVAETNRTPFDLVEAETELVAGFHTEYSGLRFGLVLHRRVRQHADGLVHRDAAVFRRLERAVRPDDGSGRRVVRASRSACFMFFYMWLRATLPRLRYDRLMAFGWKVLLPVATLNLVVTAIVVAFRG